MVIDGFTHIESGPLIRPFVTLGLVDGVMKGPTIGSGVKIETGAKVLGPVVIGDGANIGPTLSHFPTSNPDDGVVVGVPAKRVVRSPGTAARTTAPSWGTP